MAPPPVLTENLEPDTFLPVKDYISCSELVESEEYITEQNHYFSAEDEEENEFLYNTEDTLTNTNR